MQFAILVQTPTNEDMGNKYMNKKFHFFRIDKDLWMLESLCYKNRVMPRYFRTLGEVYNFCKVKGIKPTRSYSCDSY